MWNQTQKGEKMIRIIKHGNRRVIECENCGCVFSYEKEDVKTEQIGVNDFMSYVQCPDCKNMHEGIPFFD